MNNAPEDVTPSTVDHLLNATLTLVEARISSVDIDSIFAFQAPRWVQEGVQELTEPDRASFYDRLGVQLTSLGLSLIGGAVHSGLQIRKNR